MKKWKYEHIICSPPNRELFYKQCAAIEKHIPNLRKESMLEDVDGSLIQSYYLENEQILVINDEDFGLVVNTNIDIEPYFKKEGES